MSARAGRGRPSLARKVVSRVAAAVTVVLLALGLFLDRTLERAFLDDLTHSLVQQANAVAAALPAEERDLQPAVLGLARRLEVRVTLIRTDGSVVAESERDPSRIENHADRPEVRAALRGRTGVATRRSATVGEPFRYVALPPDRGLIVRVALPLSIVDTRLAAVRRIIAIGVALAVVVGILTVAAVARALTRPLERMTGAVAGLAEGERLGRLEPDGTAELGVLADTINRMAVELERRLEEIREDRATRELILTTMDEGVILVEPDGTPGYVNPAAAKLLDGLSAAGRARLPAALTAVIREAREVGAISEAHLPPGASSIEVRASAVSVEQDGRVLVVLRDVTEARRLERIRRDFVANASHELKTPAASIQASAETVRRAIAEDPEAAGRFAAQVEREALRLTRLVSDLLDLSRLEGGSRGEELVQVHDLVRTEVAKVRERADGAGLAMTSRLDPATVTGTAADLSLLVANLLDNAIRYTQEGGSIAVSVHPTNADIQIVVSDTGVGIPTRDLPRIFERFYRVDPARSRATGGTGLGLAIAKHIAELHGGRIEAESELGRGSTFRVRLPRAG